MCNRYLGCCAEIPGLRLTGWEHYLALSGADRSMLVSPSVKNTGSEPAGAAEPTIVEVKYFGPSTFHTTSALIYDFFVICDPFAKQR